MDPKSPFAHYYEYIRHPSWPAWANVTFDSEGDLLNGVPVAIDTSTRRGRTIDVKLPRREVGKLGAAIAKREEVKRAFEVGSSREFEGLTAEIATLGD